MDPDTADKWTDIALELAEWVAAAAIIYGWATGLIEPATQLGQIIVGAAAVVLLGDAARKLVMDRILGGGDE